MTHGEQVFVEYLDSISLPHAYEPDVAGPKHPDFKVHTKAGDVMCEVKDFVKLTDEDRAGIEKAKAGLDGAWMSAPPYDRIRERIREASKQLREFKGRHPCLVVLFDAAACVNLNSVTVLGAMYGDALISIPIDHGSGVAFEPGLVFDRDTRKLTSTSNTTVSAVAILEYTQPNQRLLDDAVAARDFGTDRDAIARTLEFVRAFAFQHPEVHIRVPRLQVFRNRYAAVPWPQSAFDGPHDSDWPAGDP